MKTAVSTLLCGAAALAALSFSGVAAAQGTWSDPVTWNFGAPCNTPSCTAGGVELTVAGFGFDSRYSSNYQLGTITNQDPNGLGFRSRNETTNSPNHAFDNRGGTSGGTNYGATNEVLLLNFGSAKINLTAIQTGWSDTDTDVMVFRWTKDDAPTLTSTAGPAGLLTAGWALVSAKDMDGVNTTTFTKDTDRTFTLNTGAGYVKANSDDKVSSWWLVSTYFAGAGVSGSNLEAGNDYFKLLSFTGKQFTPDSRDNPNETPEPGTLALAAAAFLALTASRRRQRVVR